MNKQQYLVGLKQALQSYQMTQEEIEEILLDYQEHFENKLASGYSEEEISVKLGDPKTIAAQFAEEEGSKQAKSKVGAGKKICLILLSIWMIVADIVLYAFTLTLGAIAIAVVGAGIGVMIGNVAPYLNVPYMPTLGGILVGIAFIALGILVFVGMIYYTATVNSANRIYFRWVKKKMRGKNTLELSVIPKFSGKTKRRLRATLLIMLVIFIAFLIASFVYLSLTAGSVEFWHVWNWFTN